MDIKKANGVWSLTSTDADGLITTTSEDQEYLVEDGNSIQRYLNSIRITAGANSALLRVKFAFKYQDGSKYEDDEITIDPNSSVIFNNMNSISAITIVGATGQEFKVDYATYI